MAPAARTDAARPTVDINALVVMSGILGARDAVR
jgi:hypothetical protein